MNAQVKRLTPEEILRGIRRIPVEEVEVGDLLDTGRRIFDIQRRFDLEDNRCYYILWMRRAFDNVPFGKRVRTFELVDIIRDDEGGYPL